MSVEAISWAFAQPIRHSTAKFVLVAMANHADADRFCWPSIPHLIEQTAQDRKTVQENIRRLREWGFIEDTGERKGSTKQVIVYRLKTPENGPVSDASDNEKRTINTPENGPVKEAQKRNSSENGTGPNFPHNRPVFPSKEARFSRETGPKTGPGTVMEPSEEPSGNHQIALATLPAQKFVPLDALLSLGVDEQTARDWLQLRKAKKAVVTKTALEVIVKEAELAGIPLASALQLGCQRGWTGFKAEWVQPRQRAQQGPAGDAQRQADNEEAYRMLFGKNKSEVIDV
ncbi:MAG TPA: helix-turn-helix domain-containing protein [Noviherbaspirillum sp.]|jgi:hypothetical protein|uniref:helix-turn-helix domain-containing protein n=1 Tax=Noviherbaspirillum sp. TaxID=1926288 RepID=UPI002F932167